MADDLHQRGAMDEACEARALGRQPGQQDARAADGGEEGHIPTLRLPGFHPLRPGARVSPLLGADIGPKGPTHRQPAMNRSTVSQFGIGGL